MRHSSSRPGCSPDSVQVVQAVASASRSARPEITVYGRRSLPMILQQLAPACEEAVARIWSSTSAPRTTSPGRSRRETGRPVLSRRMRHGWPCGPGCLADAESRRSLLSKTGSSSSAQDDPLNIQSPQDLLGRTCADLAGQS